MAITPLALVTRTAAGAALTQVQFDKNYTDIQTAVNAIITKAAVEIKDDGEFKDAAIKTAAQITDAIITLAKMVALTGDMGKWLRANESTGVIEAREIQQQVDNKTTAITSTGVQAGLDIGTYAFSSVPAGTVLVWVRLWILRNAGTNGGTVTISHGATDIDDANTHCVDAAGVGQWIELNMFGKLTGFAGGTLTLNLVFETGEVTSNVTFGVGGENRFGRRVMILAGL